LSLIYQKWPDDSPTPWGANRSRFWSVADSPEPDRNGIVQPYDPAGGDDVLYWRWRWLVFIEVLETLRQLERQAVNDCNFEYRKIPCWSIVIPVACFDSMTSASDVLAGSLLTYPRT